MTRYTFSGPRRTAVSKGICPICGRRGQRQRTIEHAVNPFNRNEDGSPKTYEEVLEDVRAAARAWAAEPFSHERCEEAK